MFRGYDFREHSFMVGLGLCFDMILIAYIARMWYLYYNNGYESIDDEDIIDYRVPEESHYTVISSQPQTYYQQTTTATGPSYQSPTPQYYHPGYQQSFVSSPAPQYYQVPYQQPYQQAYPYGAPPNQAYQHTQTY